MQLSKKINRIQSFKAVCAYNQKFTVINCLMRHSNSVAYEEN